MTAITSELAIFLPGAYGKPLKYDMLIDGAIVLVPTVTGAYITMTAHVKAKRAYATSLHESVALLMWSLTYDCWICPMFTTAETFAKMTKS